MTPQDLHDRWSRSGTGSIADDDSGAGATPRLRETPYHYTSFSDREVVIRLLGADDADVDADYIVVEHRQTCARGAMAAGFVARANRGGIERVLL